MYPQLHKTILTRMLVLIALLAAQGTFKACRISGVSIFKRIRRWYDAGMTTTKIAITLPEEQLARVNRAVREGRADSVSGYITRALVEQEREESLRTLVRDLIAQHGEPTPQEKKWAKRVLRTRRRA